MSGGVGGGSKPFDYSKWDNIELSDDEDDVHPNIDRESWFRMKHRSRVEREEREEADKKRIHEEMAAANLRMREIQKILSKIDGPQKGGGGNDEDGSDSDDDDLEDVDGLRTELSELKRANSHRQNRLDEYEKNKKWNVDNMCRVVEERTIVNPKSAEERFSSNTGYALPDDDDEYGEKGKKKVEKEEDGSGAIVQQGDGGAAAKPTKEAVVEAPAEAMAAAKLDGGGDDGVQKKAPSKATDVNAAAAAAPKKKASATTAPASSAAGPQREVVAMMSYHEFTEKYADVVEDFMKLRDMNRSKDFLLQHGNVLLQENASNYLLLASLEDEMNGFHDKMRLTARQSQIVSNIAELAKSLQSHPGNVIIPFFKRMEQKETLDGFLEGVEAFISRIEKRAVEKKKEIDAERAAAARAGGSNGDEEAVDLKDLPREERLGPGGLDPVEVFESLPKAMQEAFESREMKKLEEALLQLTPEEAERHMKRCVASGLWNE